MKAKDVVRMLEANGWYLKRIRGSHHIFKHPEKPVLIPVVMLGNKDVPEGTLHTILKQAGLR